LNFPDSWDVVTYWPNTPLPLTDKEIQDRIHKPIDQPPLRELAKGKRSPVVIVDDLARPTPVFRIMPFLLEEFYSAGLHAHQIRILVATGTHGDQDKTALTNKIGKASFESCRVIIHNDKKHAKLIGRSSFGTPVYVNPEVLKSDLVIGIGGIYPQHTTGFGGGGKLALGILGRKSIVHLHYGDHGSVGGTYNIDNNFRRDVTEMARMIGLNTIFTLHINGQLEVVNLICGDHFTYYQKAAEFSRKAYDAPLPEEADVVVANAYPFDTSFTFMRKGYRPLDLAPKLATRVMVASNHEGMGTHGLFQHIEAPRFLKYRILYRKLTMMKPKVILSKALKHAVRQNKTRSTISEENYALPHNTSHLWIYHPNTVNSTVPEGIGITSIATWDEILETIKQEQRSEGNISVRIYPCAPLQCFNGTSAQTSSS
jgi:nickel-dependent lactate racemase